MGSAAAILVWLVILAAIAWFLVGGGLAALSGGKKTEKIDPGATLRYAVPEGQDPAAIMAALAPAGYVTRVEEPAGTRILVIARDEGEVPDRGAVRTLIAQADTTIQDPAQTSPSVQFVDEVA